MRALRVSGAIVLATLLAASCRSVTEPAAWDDVETGDGGFVAAPPTDREAAAAEIARKGAWTLEDAIRYADLANPQLAAERRNIDLATAALWQARLYPNPSFVFGFEELAPFDRPADTKVTAGVSLPLVVGDRVAAASSLAEVERETAAMEFLGRRRALLSQVKRAFVRVLAAEDRRVLAAQTVDLARTLRQAASDRLAAQAVPEMEVLKATVTLARAEVDLRETRKEASIARRELLGLLGATGREDLRFVGELRTDFPDISLDETRTNALGSHPTLQAAGKRVEAARRAVEFERAKRVRDWDLDVVGGRSADAEFIVEAGIKVPLTLRDRNEAGIRAAEVRAVQARLELDAARLSFLARLGQAYDAFTAARDLVGIFRATILPQATKALEQTREGYRVGKFGYLDLLDAQRTLAEARIGRAAAVAELNESAATLEELGGVRLTPNEQGPNEQENEE